MKIFIFLSENPRKMRKNHKGHVFLRKMGGSHLGRLWIQITFGVLHARATFFTITVSSLLTMFKILGRTLRDLIIKPYLCLVDMFLKDLLSIVDSVSQGGEPGKV